MRGRWLALLLALAGCATPPGVPARPDGVASASAPLALSADGRSLWVVAPDADVVTRVDTATLVADAPVPVGREPWAVAVTPGGTVVTMNRLDGGLSVLDGGRRRDVPVGPEPGGLALSPSGRLAFVTVSGADEVAVVDLAAGEVVHRLPVGRMPWAVAVTDDGDLDDDDEAVIVTHRLARLRPGRTEGGDDAKEAWLTVLEGGARREVALPDYAFGHPNAVEGLAVRGRSLWTSHLLAAPERPRDFETTVSGALTGLALDGGPTLRLDVNDPDFSTPTSFPRAVALAPDGRTAYLALAGTDAVMGVDLAAPDAPRLLGFWPAGSNPRGLLVSPDGARGYAMNYLSRDVSVLDLADVRARREVARVVVASETLPTDVLRGKVLFHNANDPRLSHLGWISCASCHLDGGTDGTTWATPDGPRQTQPLWRLEGTAPFHASATRDEVQDFEEDIETLMDGSGLAPGAVGRALGAPSAGRSADLDALAAYVLRGIRAPRAPPGDDAARARGRVVFARAGCAACHGGPRWTASALPGPPGTLAPGGEVEVRAALRDVGTHDPARDVLGARGFDVPGLLGLHATAPYLHDGSAATLEAVLDGPRHAPADLSDADRADLVAFLEGIGEGTPPLPAPP